ncbi:MAG: head decoration protein [Spirochaetota bacterium]
MANPTKSNLDNRALVVGRAFYDARTILSGESVSEGDVLGAVTATGKLRVCDSTETDGSEVAIAVATKDIDAAGGDVTDQDVLIAGEVNGDLLTFGGTDDLADHFDELRDVGIIPVTGEAIGEYNNA